MPIVGLKFWEWVKVQGNILRIDLDHFAKNLGLKLGRKSKFWPKIGFLAENRLFDRKSKILSKIFLKKF